MNRRYPTAGRALAAASLFLVAAQPALAARALVLNAYDAEALGLGGAEIAATGSTTAVNSNPAGLAQLAGQGFDVFAYPYWARFQHTDALGNDTGIAQPVGAVVAGSYARRLAALPDVVAGAGLFVQGGTGLGYDALQTAYGNRDALASNIAVYKLVAGVGWNVNAQLNLGASVGIAYAQGRQKLFPNTSDVSDPSRPFFGLRFDGGAAATPNVQIGVQYRPLPQLSLAATYISKTPLPLTGGTVTVDFDALGLGRVKYRDARFDGFGLPQEVDLGIAYRPRPRWLLAMEVNWLDYSNALASSRLRASHPDNPSAPATLDAVSPLGWHDQYVLAMGGAYTLDERDTLRAGFNIENSPIPDSTASPILNFGQKREITFGYGHKFAGTWSFDFALEYQFPVYQTYHNPGLPLGDSAREKYEDVSAIFAISRRW